MTAEEFYIKFIEKAKEEIRFETEETGKNYSEFNKKVKSEICEQLNGKNYLEIYRNHAKQYTNLVNRIIIPETIKSLEPDCVIQHEYLRIDTVGWIDKKAKMEKEAKKIGFSLNAHLWDLKIAVEHENNSKDWTDEVIKLVHVKCPLKVVIGYSPCDERDNEEIEKLKFIAKWMNEVNDFNNAFKEEYLIILGNGKPKRKKSSDYDKFDYRGYMYDSNRREFKRITGR